MRPLASGRCAGRPRSRAVGRRFTGLLTVGPDDAPARLWTGAITRAVSGAVLDHPAADEAWLRAEVAELSAHLPSGYRAARRRAAPPCAPAC